MAATELDNAPRGARTALARSIAAALGISVATLYSRIAALRAPRERKRRRDRGQCTLTREEALLIRATVESTRRETGTGTLPLDEAVAMLRANGRIVAARLDEATGELVPLSISAIRRAMRGYGFAVDQVHTETRAQALCSRHPNETWQIDASVSRQFYLADSGAQVMTKREFYRGKPGNFVAINERRIWRYVVTDHASGALEVVYVQGAESAANAVLALIHTLTQRDGGTMYGVPRRLVLDVGSGNTAGAMRTLCESLGIELVYTAPGNPRAKGQVEQAQHIVERLFEAGLKLRAPVTSIDEINGLAQRWAAQFNATRIHSRHRMTRRDAWLRITPAQLVLAPSIEVLRALAHSTPVSARVRDGYVRAYGQRWDVRGLPDVINGQTLAIVRNALDTETVRVLLDDVEIAGRTRHYLAPRVGVDEFGFLDTATPYGEFATLPQTPAEARAVELDKLITGEETREAREAARKAKRVPFAGAIDPTAAWSSTPVPPALPRAATASTVAAPEVIAPVAAPVPIRQYESPPLTGIALVKRIKAALEARGGTWTAELYEQCEMRWPEGVAEERVEDCAITLLRPRLAAINGGA